MMKTKIILLFIAAAFTACEGEQGEPGTPGTPGTNGNANVHTQIFDVTVSSGWWLIGNNYYLELQAPFITSEIAATGTVFVQREFSFAAGTWENLPVTDDVGSDTFITNYYYEAGNVVLSYANVNGSAVSIPTSGKFKVTAIAGQ